MTVVTALFIDAYRQLNAKKLFWITLAISGIVVAFYASIGVNDSGMTMFFGLTEIGPRTGRLASEISTEQSRPAATKKSS